MSQSNKLPDDWKIRPARRNPVSGKLVVPAPPGMSNEEFARITSDAMAKQSLPKGMTESQRQDLVEKTRNNISLEPVDLAPPLKASRFYGTAWLYLGVFLALGTAVVVGIRFWRAN